jgi:hypothetical protein
MKVKILLFAFITIIFFGCTENQTITEIEHVNQVIDDNAPTPFNGITTTQIHAYINRIYIDLIGREPTTAELTNWTTYLKDNQITIAAKKTLVSNIQGTITYYDRLYDIYSGQLLGGVSNEDIDSKISLYEYFRDNAYLQGDTIYAQAMEYRLLQLGELKTVATDYLNNTINLNEFFARFPLTPIFDDINMGNENFVLACFEGFFKRYPTDIELYKSVRILQGNSEILLLEDGSSKADFIEIMTTVPAFYEGLTIEVYRQLLARNPSSVEMVVGTLELTSNGDYQSLQQKVMITDEYSGF